MTSTDFKLFLYSQLTSKIVKMSSFDVKWRQSVWRVMIPKIWRLCDFKSIYDVFWHILTIVIFWKKFLTIFDEFWRWRKKPLMSFDVKWRQLTFNYFNTVNWRQKSSKWHHLTSNDVKVSDASLFPKFDAYVILSRFLSFFNIFSRLRFFEKNSWRCLMNFEDGVKNHWCNLTSIDVNWL